MAGSRAVNETTSRSPGMRFPRGLRTIWWCLALAIPLLLGGWMVAQRAAETGPLRRANAHLQRGEWYAALASLEPLRSRPLLSGLARRQAAELYLRLGEDQKGHQLLIGQKFHPNDPADARLKALATRCQRAEALIRQANQTKSLEQRYELTRQAQDEMPESPRVLQQLVRVELALMLKDPKSAAGSRFEPDYTQLRLAAPPLADQVRTEAEAMAGEVR